MSLARLVDEDWPIAMRLARLTQRKEFLAAAEHGRRFRSSAFTAQVRDAVGEDGRDGLRLGLTASRKVGNAVKRNRIRRRLRAAAGIALADQAARPCDLVIVARPEVLTAGFDQLVADLSIAIERARPARPGGRRFDPKGKVQPRKAQPGNTHQTRPSKDQRRSPPPRSAPSKS